MRHALKIFVWCGVILVCPLLASAQAFGDDNAAFFRGDVAPANSSTFTITRSGVYALTCAKTASGVPAISITANNVTLDLDGNTITGGTDGIQVTGNNVTIQNGTISNMSGNGILLQGTGCRVENCDLVSCTTGITLQNAQACIIESCRVRNATQAGVSLMSSWTNSVLKCEVAAVRGVGSVYGVIAQNGGSTTVEQCLVREIRTSSATGADKVIGIALVNEAASSVCANAIQGVESLTTVSAYGLWINGGNNALVENNTVMLVSTSNVCGQGVLVNQTQSYVANNLCYDCDKSFTGVSTQLITSQANDRGAYNSDALLTTSDALQDMHDQQLTTIESQIDSTALSYSLMESLVDGFCVDVPITTPVTLSTAGSYCLGGTINGSLLITGTGVSLCMNGHTINGGALTISGDRVVVSNGTVRGNASASGVLVTGNYCFLDGIRSVGNRTGFEFNGATENTVTNCNALGCTREGFLLSSSSKNYIGDCQVLSLAGTGTVAGFKTTSGTSNKIVNCTVNSVTATTGDAYGIWGVTEQKSLISGNTVNDVSATAGVAKGIALDQNMWLRNVVSFEQTFSGPPTAAGSTAWLDVRPGLAYIAFGGQPLRIFRFAGGKDFDLIYELTLPAAVASAEWFFYSGTYYLAVTWNGAAGIDVQVYIFDLVSESLVALPNATYNYDTSVTPVSIKWLDLGDGQIFLTLGGAAIAGAPNEIRMLLFDGNSLSFVRGVDLGSVACNQIEWYLTGTRVFLGAAENTTGAGAFAVYEFSRITGSLDLKTTWSTGTGVGSKLRWLNYGNDSYIALGTGAAASDPEVRVLKYTIATNTLAQLATVEVGVIVGSCDWLVSGTTIYLTFSNYNTASSLIKIYTFNPTTNALRLYYEFLTPADAYACYRAYWDTNQVLGRAFLAAGFASVGDAYFRTVSVFGFDMVGTTTSIVQNNTVSNVAGTGIAVNDLSNSVLNNKVYNATTPYYPWAPYRFDRSNGIIS